MVLKHIIEAFDATHYAHASMGMVTLAKNATVSCVGILEVLQALGTCDGMPYTLSIRACLFAACM